MTKIELYNQRGLGKLSTKEILDYQAKIQIQLFRIDAELMLRGEL